MDFVKLANSLDQEGLYKEADLIDYCVLLKNAQYGSIMGVDALAGSIYQILQYLAQRSSPDKQFKFWENVRKGLMRLNPVIIGQKKSNPAASTGAAINIIKNVLIGQHPSIVAGVLSQLQRYI